MRSLAFLAPLALACCAHPPHAAPPGGEQPPAPAPAPQHQTWDETRWPAQTPAAPGQAQTDAPGGGRPLIGGATLYEITVQHNGRAVDLQCVLFDDRHYHLRIIDQPEDWSGGGQITASMRGVNAAAGVNGGFFTPQFAPLGLMIANGRKTGAWQQNKLLTGAIVVDSQPRLLWNAETGRDSARELLQAGPRLVDSGRAVASLERARHTTRTFIATDAGRRWIIGLAHGVSLGELAGILASPEFLPGFHVHRALNLDGGRSSAIYYRAADGHEHADPGWSTVRNYLAIVPR